MGRISEPHTASEVHQTLPRSFDLAAFEASLPEDRFLDSPGRSSLLLDRCLVVEAVSPPSLDLAFSGLQQNTTPFKNLLHTRPFIGLNPLTVEPLNKGHSECNDPSL